MMGQIQILKHEKMSPYGWQWTIELRVRFKKSKEFS